MPCDGSSRRFPPTEVVSRSWRLASVTSAPALGNPMNRWQQRKWHCMPRLSSSATIGRAVRRQAVFFYVRPNRNVSQRDMKRNRPPVIEEDADVFQVRVKGNSITRGNMVVALETLARFTASRPGSALKLCSAGPSRSASIPTLSTRELPTGDRWRPFVSRLRLIPGTREYSNLPSLKLGQVR